jgi:hypothetical protein
MASALRIENHWRKTSLKVNDVFKGGEVSYVQRDLPSGAPRDRRLRCTVEYQPSRNQ